MTTRSRRTTRTTYREKGSKQLAELHHRYATLTMTYLVDPDDLRPRTANTSCRLVDYFPFSSFRLWLAAWLALALRLPHVDQYHHHNLVCVIFYCAIKDDFQLVLIVLTRVF